MMSSESEGFLGEGGPIGANREVNNHTCLDDLATDGKNLDRVIELKVRLNRVIGAPRGSTISIDTPNASILSGLVPFTT